MKLKKFFKLAGLVLLLSGITIWLLSDFWAVKKISCHLNNNPCPEFLWAQMMNLAGGKNSLFLSPNEIALQVMQKHKVFSQVKIKKQLPHHLVINIESRKAVAAIDQKEEGFYLVDKDGVLLEKKEGLIDLPIILSQERFEQETGAKIQDPLTLIAIQFIFESQLRLLEPKMLKIISKREVQLWLKNDVEVLFSVEKNLSDQLDSLQFISQRAKIEGESLKRIDLRFDKPIIVK